MRILILVSCFAVGCTGRAVSPTKSDPSACHGERRALVIARQMPLTIARVGGVEGLFVLDTATTASTIDVTAFATTPKPVAGTSDDYEPFEFYGSWGRVHLNGNRHRGLAGLVKVAGLIGTDFLSRHVYTFDYEHSAVYRSEAREFCNDDVLLREGLRPLSSEGYYVADLARLRPESPNVPTVPIRIGGVSSVAQIDTAFTDSMIRHSVNINRALLNALVAAGVKLTRAEGIPLSTCVPGVSETTYVYRGTARFELVSTDGVAARFSDDATYLLKETPKAAQHCGGIGTWSTPAAQIGASFYVDAGRMVFDPFSSRVWVPKG